MVIISVIVFMIIAHVPFLADIFGIAPLQNRVDYALVLGSALIWIIVVNIFWRLFPVATRVGGKLKDVPLNG